jgi:Na+/phosphate symporter
MIDSAETRRMWDQTIAMLSLTWEGFRRQDGSPFAEALKLGREVHQQEQVLTAAGGELVFVPMHLERIGDNLEALVASVQTMVQETVPFTERAMREVGGLFERTMELLECARDAVLTRNRVLIRYVIDQARHQAQLADDFARAHQQRLAEGVCLPTASSLYLAMLDHFKGVAGHAREVAEQLAARAGTSPRA